jgi:hypothetical protein
MTELSDCYKKGLCEHCCEYAMSDEDLALLAKKRGYRLEKRDEK